jgi:hypothetical protein
VTKNAFKKGCNPLRRLGPHGPPGRAPRSGAWIMLRVPGWEFRFQCRAIVNGIAVDPKRPQAGLENAGAAGHLRRRAASRVKLLVNS